MRSPKIIKSIGVMAISALVAIFVMVAISGCGKDHNISIETINAVSNFLSYIDIPGRMYDLRAQLPAEQRPWLIGAIIMVLAVLSLILPLVFRNINLRKQKETEAKIREADERARLMLDSTPLACTLIDKDYKCLDCNKEALNLFGVPTKQEYVQRFLEFWPERQSDGQKSMEKGAPIFQKAFDDGYARCEWLHIIRGEPMLAEVTLVRVEYGGDNVLACYIRDLRAEKKAEAQASEADERARLMIEFAPIVVMLWDKDGTILDCNQEAVRLLGVSSKQEYIDRFYSLTPEYQSNGMRSVEVAQESINKTLKTGYNRLDWTVNHALTGEAIPFDCTIVRFKYKDGYAMLSYAQDLRELKASTKMLMEKTSLLTAILDSVSDPIFCLDLDSRYTECNKSFENYFNVRKSDLIGKGNIEALGWSPDVTAQHEARDKKVFAEKKTLSAEELIPSADGRVQLFETIKSPITHDGKVTGLVGLAHDITHRKAAEEELNRQNSLMSTVNAAAAILLVPGTDDSFDAISQSMEMVCQSMDADRVFLWKNTVKDDGSLHYKQMYKWARPEYAMDDDFPEYSYKEAMPAWKDLLFEGKSINGPLDTLPGYDPEIFSIYMLQSILIVPLFLKGEYWGFVSFDDCHNRRSFPEADELILRSWGLLVVGAIQRGKIVRDLEYAMAEAETANRAKSSFLATMSHEIRTPMNAISGMAELLLRRDLPHEAKAEAQDIKQAASNLISIINDILDFSKIEAGKLELVPVKYMLSSLINDTANIIRTRLTEKPIRFYTNIDGSIPNNLIGDEVRLRQVLLNLLSNAVKYTEKGHISLSIIVQKREGKQVWLEIAVTDTGKGIKPEDQKKLFDSFVQVDTKKNRGIEGTGLGLAITKQLCLLMNGNITLKSEYGKGSEFKVVIPQDFSSPAAFAAVIEPEKKKVLVYERRAVYAHSLCWSLENLGVPYVIAETQEEFTEALSREEWYYIFSGHGLYEKIKPLLMDNTVLPNGRRPPLALMVEWDNEANIPNVRFISLPVQSLSIANVLNGKADFRNYFNTENFGVIRFTYPGARLLVVDDISTNLKVTEGLLAPYNAKIDTTLSGARAIDLVKQHKYDIVFMDHMMPEMDGIEATEEIRAWEAEQGITRIAVPIIALTANVVSGMKEMFIENGFSDFLAKPIDISKLDEMLERWIPKEKRGTNNTTDSPVSHSPLPHSLPPIPGIDIQRGISMTGGTIALYRQVIGLFRSDAEERLPLLQNVPDAGTLSGFITDVHAIKSASASIGAAEISAKAAKLEAAGRAADFGFIRENLPGFADDLAELVEGIRAWENAQKEQDAPKGEDAPDGEHDKAAVTQLLRELTVALETENVGDIRRLLRGLGEKPCDAKTKEALGQISDHVMMAEFGGALKIVRELTAANS